MTKTNNQGNKQRTDSNISFGQGKQKKTSNTNKKKSSGKKSHSSTKNNNKRKFFRDTNISSDQYVDHKYEDRSAGELHIKPGEKPVKIGSLLGLEQVGQAIFIETENDLILVDAGMEFSGDETLGADYIIPDISYIKKNIKKFRGIFLTHGHLDHIGAIKDIVEELNYPMIYTTPLTLGIIKKTFDSLKESNKIKYTIVDPTTDIVKAGTDFMVEFVAVNHNIPETFALSITTPKGVVFTSADFKIDHSPAIDLPADLSKMARIGTEGVKLYIGDSLGSQRLGFAPSERIIGENLDGVIKKTKGRMIVATFASNVGRVIQIIESAARHGKVVFLSGRSMISVTEIAQELGYIRVPKGTIRDIRSGEIDTMPDEKIVVLSTGAQGEEFAALTRMSRGEFRYLKLRPGDTVMTSASVIPGNEDQFETMMNDLLTSGVETITTDDMDIHTSGHGYAEDHKMFLALLKPEFFMPYYTEATLRYRHRDLALNMGMPKNRIFMPKGNGAIIELYDNGVRIADKKLKLNRVVVDGTITTGLHNEYVIDARHTMADSGFISFVFGIDEKTKDLVGNIQVESRGFLYSGEVKKTHDDLIKYSRDRYAFYQKKKRSTGDIFKSMRSDIAHYAKKLTGRSPLVVTSYVHV